MYIDIHTKSRVNLNELAKTRNLSIPQNPSKSILAALGVGRLVSNLKPTGDVVTEAEPRYDSKNDVWQQQWSVRDYTSGEYEDALADKKQQRRPLLTEQFYQVLEQGLPYSTNGATFTVQIRPQDQGNLTALRIEANELIAAGQDDTVMEFRTQENTVQGISALEMVEMTTQALQYIKAQYKTLWALKDALDDVVLLEDVDTVTWPVEE